MIYVQLMLNNCNIKEEIIEMVIFYKKLFYKLIYMHTQILFSFSIVYDTFVINIVLRSNFYKNHFYDNNVFVFYY